jgi:ABC-type transporter Mla subunit MlaD
MPTRSGTRNNLVAGLFVIASAMLAVVISVIVSGATKRLIPTNTYFIRFPVEQGAAGIKKGSIVNLGGQEIGRVTGVDFDDPAHPTSILIRVAIRSSVTLYEDAWAFLERPLLGTTSTLNIASVGTGVLPPGKSPQGTGPLLEPGEILEGRIAPPSFLTQAGYGPEQIRQVQTMIAQAAELVDRVNTISIKVDNEINPTLAKARKFIDDVQAASTEFTRRAPDWAGRVDQILAKTDDAGTRLNAALDHADDVVRSFRETLAANRPSIDATVANIREAAEKVNHESVALVNQTLEKAGTGSEEFATAAARFNALVSRELPNIENTIANLRLASDQAKLTMIEVRRNPWRLFYRPQTKELDSELFYDAARSYATAVSDLRAASEALQATSQSGPGVPQVDRETAADLHARIEDAFSRYQDAERKLLKLMGEKAP